MSSRDYSDTQRAPRWEDLRTDGAYERNPSAREVTPNGVNITALRYTLTLTPAERIRRASGWARLAMKLHGRLAPRSRR